MKLCNMPIGSYFRIESGKEVYQIGELGGYGRVSLIGIIDCRGRVILGSGAFRVHHPIDLDHEVIPVQIVITELTLAEPKLG